jgi:hypothetical protein
MHSFGGSPRVLYVILDLHLFISGLCVDAGSRDWLMGSNELRRIPEKSVVKQLHVRLEQLRQTTNNVKQLSGCVI